MKKYLLIFLLITNNSILKSKDFSGYCNLGFSASQVSGDNLSGFNKIGFVFGIGTKKFIYENIYLDFEIKYVEKGSRNPKLNQNNIPQIQLTYIETPISIGMKQKKNNYTLGISYGSLINSKEFDYYGEINNFRPFKNHENAVFVSFERQLKNKTFINFTLSNSFLLTPIRNHASNTSLWYNRGQYNTVLYLTIKHHIINIK